MKPEECSKEELIYYLKNKIADHIIFPQEFEHKLEFEILVYRQEKAYRKCRKEAEIVDKKLRECTELAESVSGTPITEISDEILKTMRMLDEEQETHYRKSERYWKEYESIGKRIDEMFNKIL